MDKLFLKPGEIIVVDHPALIKTVLGSCVAVTVFDPVLKIAGMCHYLLPAPAQEGNEEASANRYGCFAIRNLLAKVKSLGSDRSNLVVSVLGGSHLITAPTDGESHQIMVGKENIALAKKLLAQFHLTIQKEAVGGSSGRVVELNSVTGEIRYKYTSETAIEIATPATKRLALLYVDSNATNRQVMENLVIKNEQLRHFDFFGASDELDCQELKKLGRLPSVAILNFHFAKFDLLAYYKSCLKRYGVATIGLSGIDQNSSAQIFDALETGLFDMISLAPMGNLEDYHEELIQKILAAQRWKEKMEGLKLAAPAQRPVVEPSMLIPPAILDRYLMAIGSSTGGTEALKELLLTLPRSIPPTVVVQHIPEVFSKALADRLNVMCPFKVTEARHAEQLERNHVYIAPGGKQMKVKESSQGLHLIICDDPPVNRFKPSVDYLFNSIADQVSSRKIIAAILTGMGNDGARGLLRLKRERRASTFGQDEKSCVVYGMPKAAYDLGAVDFELPLTHIGPRMIALVR